MKPAPRLYAHQEQTAAFSLTTNKVLDASDPGTGKTLATLSGFLRRRENEPRRRLLVVAPLSIIEPSWGNDIRRFTMLRYRAAVGSATARTKAFLDQPDVVLLNTDGVKWLVKHRGLVGGFTDLCIDEFTSFKNRTSQRSRAMLDLAQHFWKEGGHITILSGTSAPNTLTDLWHPVLILDGGRRLGTSFFRFREQVCTPRQIGPMPQHIKWEDKPGMDAAVASALKDVTIRHKFEDCVDVPEHNVIKYPVVMPERVMEAYRQMESESILSRNAGEDINAVHAAVRAQKMLQILSGSVYDNEGEAVPVHNQRYELVGELAEERDHVIIGFTWQHEKEGVLKELAKRKLSAAVIDGTVPVKERTRVVERYQAGEIRALLCHPASAAHGLTLTRGRATIWCSATTRPEFFQQLNRRIYRAGQTKRTETICIYAQDTKEEDVYNVLDSRMAGMTNLLELLLNGQNATTEREDGNTDGAEKQGVRTSESTG